jgi:hypothetical protein
VAVIPNLPWLNAFCIWLEHTRPSQTIQTVPWIVPTVQVFHILSIAVVAASALMIALRLLGAYSIDQPGQRVAKRFLPLVWWPILILLATGLIMIVGEPGRSLKNPAFQLKMALLAGALIVTLLCQRRLRRAPAAGAAGTGVLARPLAILSLLLWAAIIFAGRWIAYS